VPQDACFDTAFHAGMPPAVLGVAINQQRNDAARGEDADISAGSAPVRTLVITAREDIEIARQVGAALSADAHPHVRPS
jgi:acetate kinase